ncbi:hypothetical protein L6164_036250 [Bauhinia variegata]|uniref:Uncharacterized protein n=1 Tax=Bauhinia variegata TaxID=167791 RepID=A0ACB9KGH0_BAUVA|nr:hypothetical protein L6164_036250 [Bauhinia variegata]
MERSEHSLVPQWLKSGGSSNNQLKSPHSDQITHSRFRRSFNSNNSGHSRSYNSSSRSWYNRVWENDIENLSDKGKLVFSEGEHRDHSGSLTYTLTNRFEKDLFQCSQSMGSGRWGETWSNRTAADLSNAKSDAMVARGVVGSMHKTVFEEEFPSLGPEAKQGSSETGSSGSSPATHNLLTGPSAVITNNGLTSALHGIPVTIGTSSSAAVSNQYNDSASFSSMASSIAGLNMAGALSQGTPRSQTPPQSSVDAQKLEELAIKQSRLLVPITPSMPRALVVSPSEKSKVKTGQQQHLFFSSRPANHSPRGGPARSDGPKTTSDNSRIVSPSRELTGLSSAEKDSLSPSGSRIVPGLSNNSSNNANPALGGTLEKRATSQAKSRSDFFKSLSNKSSSRNPSSDTCSSRMPCASESSEVITGNVTVLLTQQFEEAPSLETSAGTSLTESSCTITDSGNACGEPLKFSSNEMQQLSSKSILYPDEEEAAFLRSLGWEESAGEDEGLTEEEIKDFYEKYMKLQPSSNILHKVHQRMTGMPLDSNTGSCGGASSELS